MLGGRIDRPRPRSRRAMPARTPTPARPARGTPRPIRPASRTAGPEQDATLIGSAPAGRRPPDDEPPPEFRRYRIKRELGRGGMGAVYLARDQQLDRDVALKVPTATAAEDPDVRARFLREGRAAATLQHPNLCPVFDAGEEPVPGGGTRPYLTMAYLSGRSLDDAPAGPLPIRNAVKLIARLADAMAHAHARGVIHRDLKPANVMLDDRGRPRITDFGLARRDAGVDGGARLTRAGASLGTPAYMSPEQILGEQQKIGPKTDIYSLGVMLYELLTGRPPFEGTATAVVGQALTRDPTPPSALRPEVDPALEAIWRRMTARDPAERYDDMHAVRAALLAYLRHRPAAPPPRKEPEPETKDDEVLSDPAADFATLPGPASLLRPPPAWREAARRRGRTWGPPAAFSLAAVGLSWIVGAALFDEPEVEPTPAPAPPAVAVDDSTAAEDAGTNFVAGDPWETPGATVDVDPSGPGWQALFDGRTLDGWEGDRSSWSVQDGVLTAELAAGERTARLYSDAWLGDVEVYAVVRTLGPANVGLNVRHVAGGNALQARACVTEGKPAFPTGSIWTWPAGDTFRTPPDVRDRVAAARATNGQPDGWDIVVLRAVGERVAVAVNGVVTASVRLPDLPPEGQIRLEVEPHGAAATHAEFRAIRVRPLDDKTPADAAVGDLGAEAAPDAGWVDLFDGRSLGSLDDWATKPKGVWSVENGELVALVPDPPQSTRVLAEVRLADADGAFRDAPADFELTFEYASSAALLKVRARERGGSVYAEFPETTGDVEWWGSLHSKASSRSQQYFRLSGPRSRELAQRAIDAADRRDGREWHRVRMKVFGRSAFLTVNGVDMGGGEDPDMFAGPEGLRFEVYRSSSRKEPVTVRLRDVRLRPLTPDGEPVVAAPPAADMDAATPAPGSLDLLAAEDVPRWDQWGWGGSWGPSKETGLARWRMEDGVMVGTLEAVADGGQRSSYLIFPRDLPQDFELHAVVRTFGSTDSALTIRDSPATRARWWAGFDLGRDGAASRVGALHLGDLTSKELLRDEAAIARALAARATNGEPPGWDVVTIRATGDRLTETVNGVVTAVHPHVLLRPARVEVEVRSPDEAAARVEFRTLRLRPLNADGTPAAP